MSQRLIETLTQISINFIVFFYILLKDLFVGVADRQVKRFGGHLSKSL